MPESNESANSRGVVDLNALLSENGTADHQVKHNHLLAIAVDYYRDDRIPHLNNCIGDIEDLIEVLSTDYFFNKENIRYLRSRKRGAIIDELKASGKWDEDRETAILKSKLAEIEEFEKNETGYAFIGEADHENIIAQLRHFAEHLKPEDNIVICFSGHGIYDEVFDEGYWIPSDGEYENNASYIENSTIRVALNAMNSHHTVLISDSCYSGSLFAAKKQRALGVPKVYQHPSRWGLTAGRKNQTVSDGNVGENSPFSEQLLSILKRKQEVWISNLCNEIVESLESTEKQEPIGEPLSTIAGHENGQFVFLPRMAKESDHWRIAWTENTRKAYYNFLARYPDGEYESIALKALNVFSRENQPISRSEQMSTFDFLIEYMPKMAKSFVIKSIDPAEATLKTLSPAAINTYHFLKDVMPEEADAYAKAWIKGKKVNVLSPELRQTYDYLHVEYDQEASKFLELYLYNRQTSYLYKPQLLSDEFKETHAYFKTHFPDKAKKYLDRVIYGAATVPLSPQAKKTAEFLKQFPKEVEQYLNRYTGREITFELDDLERAQYQEYISGHRNGTAYVKSVVSSVVNWPEIAVPRLPVIGTFTDPRDQQTYDTVEIDGKIWLAQNLNFKTEFGSCFVDENPDLEDQFGRLYTWEAALKACPPGWRLPTKKEISDLFVLFDNPVDIPLALLDEDNGGWSGLNFRLAGYCKNMGNSHGGALAFQNQNSESVIWTSEENNSNQNPEAWAFHLTLSRNDLYTEVRTQGFSCRCVKDK